MNNKDKWQSLFTDAWNLLTCSNTEIPFDPDAASYKDRLPAYLTECNMVEIVCPRVVGKTTFILDHYRSGDILLTHTKPQHMVRHARRELVFQVREGHNIFKPYHTDYRGIKSTPSRYVFADEVRVTHEILDELIDSGLIDRKTKIFSLRTPMNWNS